ncbi:MAG: GAF and ANTAR domain-containing protein [Actinomycetota bacterium]
MASGPVPTTNSSTQLEARSLCSQFVDALHVDGASISMFGPSGNQSTICSTGDIATSAETFQFELGEGPHWQALSSGHPVLCSDLGSETHRQWPMFSGAARRLGISAVFAFPMKLGAATIGVVDLLSLRPRRLDLHQISLASSMTNRMASTAVALAMRSADDVEAHESSAAPALRREVHQATGMLQVQLDISATDAFARLRAYAFTAGRPVNDVAGDVVGRILDFSTLPD